MMLLVIDFGTSAVKAEIFDTDGQLLSLYGHPLRYRIPPEASPWGRELAPKETWGIICSIISKVLSKAKLKAEEIVAVSVTSQRQGIAFLDARGNDLYLGPNIDLRGVFQAVAIEEMWGDLLYSITGHRPPLLFAPARLRWFKEIRPDLYERIATLLTIDGWIVYRFTGEKAAEPAAAAETQLFDVNRRAWAGELLTLMGIPGDILPPLYEAGTMVGGISAMAGEETGLKPGTPVIIAGADTQCGLLGMGVILDGEIGVVAGWSAPIQLVTYEPIWDEKDRMWTSCHLLENKWVLESNAGYAGRACEWICELLKLKGFKELETLASQSPAGAEGVLAFLGPDVMNAGETGLPWGGLTFPLAYDFFKIKREHIARAVLENIAFAIKANIEQLGELREAVFPVRLGGGISYNALFARILAGVLGKPVQMPRIREVTGLGAAICGAVGVGIYCSLEEGAKAMVHLEEPVAPVREERSAYIDAYERWREKRVFH